MKNLLLGSLCLLFFLECKPQLYHSFTSLASEKKTLPRILDSNSPSYLYKTKVDVVGHYLSGLLIIKPTGVDTFRLVFTTELGIKFFDMELFPLGRKVHYCMEKLNKKVVLNMLEKDLKLVLMNDSPKQVEWLLNETGQQVARIQKGKKDFDYYYLNEKGNVFKVENSSKKKMKVVIEVKDILDGTPHAIDLKHYNFNMNIQLIYLERK